MPLRWELELLALSFGVESKRGIEDGRYRGWEVSRMGGIEDRR